MCIYGLVLKWRDLLLRSGLIIATFPTNCNVHVTSCYYVLHVSQFGSECCWRIRTRVFSTENRLCFSILCWDTSQIMKSRWVHMSQSSQSRHFGGSECHSLRKLPCRRDVRRPTVLWMWLVILRDARPLGWLLRRKVEYNLICYFRRVILYEHTWRNERYERSIKKQIGKI